MHRLLPLACATLLLLSLTGCLQEDEAEAHVAAHLWAERYQPVANISDVRSGGLPEVSLHYTRAGEGIRQAGIGEQVFLCYSVYVENMQPFSVTAHCSVDGEDLSPFDPEHAHLPTQYETALHLGLPAPVTNRLGVGNREVYSFRWPYRFSSYGPHHFTAYLKADDGTVIGKIERNISVEPPGTDDDRWALLVTVDPPGDEIAAWRDGALVWSLLHHRYGFPYTQVLHLSNGGATRDRVIDLMRWLSERTTRDTILVCWISGHGGIERFGDQDSEIRDGAIQLWEGTLYDGDVATFYADASSQHILSVVDTCFSGEFGGPDDLERIFTQLRRQPSVEETGRVLMTSATTFTRSKATENGGIFTTLVAGGLAGVKNSRGKSADSNGDGRISAEEAGYWAVLHCYARPGFGFPQLNDCHSGDLFLES